MTRLYFEDVVLGERNRTGEYAVERDEVIAYARKWDPQPFHLDDAAGEASIFGGLTACFSHVFAIHSHLMSRRENRLAILAGVGFADARMVRPVRPGDRLHIEFEAVAKRESRSKSDRGIVETQFHLLNQRGEEVLSMLGRAMVERRPATIEADSPGRRS